MNGMSVPSPNLPVKDVSLTKLGICRRDGLKSTLKNAGSFTDDSISKLDSEDEPEKTFESGLVSDSPLGSVKLSGLFDT